MLSCRRRPRSTVGAGQHGWMGGWAPDGCRRPAASTLRLVLPPDPPSFLRRFHRESGDHSPPCVCLATDPTGTLIIGMLSKKLERMAAEARRQQRLRRRAARKAATAAAAAAEEAAAPAGPEAAPARAGAAKPAASVAGSEAAAEEAVPGFGAALRRLFSDPQVSGWCVAAASSTHCWQQRLQHAPAGGAPRQQRHADCRPRRFSTSSPRPPPTRWPPSSS